MHQITTDTELTNWFYATTGVMQGCCLSPHLLNLILAAMMNMVMKDKENISVNIMESQLTVYALQMILT